MSASLCIHSIGSQISVCIRLIWRESLLKELLIQLAWGGTHELTFLISSLAYVDTAGPGNDNLGGTALEYLIFIWCTP